MTAPAARAQTQPTSPADSLPTARGRWAAEAGLGFDEAALGALRFLGPRSALGFNAVFNFQRQRRTDFGDLPAGGVGFSVAQFFGTAGYRGYAPVRNQLAAFGGIGALVGYSLQSAGSRTTTLGVGGYAEVGAAYLVARRLSVNVSTQLSVQRQTFRQTLGAGGATRDGELTVTSTGWRASAGGARLSATLFF